MSDESYVDSGQMQKLAKSFENYAHDLESYLRTFAGRTGEEAISDGFGVLTESDEVNSAYIEFSSDVTEAMTSVYRHLDAIGAALRTVTRNTEVTDDDTSALFGKVGGEG